MVRERQSVRPRRKTQARPKAKAAAARAKESSIWDTPHIKAMLAQPAGSAIDLTPEELQEIFQDMIDNPQPYDAKEAERRHRELRKMRRMWGSLISNVDG